MPCIYDQTTPLKRGATHLEAEASSSTRDTRSRSRSAADKDGSNVSDCPESKERRLLELKLLHSFVTKTSASLQAKPFSPQEGIWTTILPRLAFKNDGLLYAMFSVAAIHLAFTESPNAEIMEAHRYYLDLALQEHSKEIDNITKENVDVLILASTLVRVTAMAAMQERSCAPYAPPVQWLRLASGAGRIFHATWDLIKDNEHSVGMMLLNREPRLTPFNETLFAESNRDCFPGLVRAPDQSEPWDEEIESVYGTTVSYIGSIQLAVQAQEAPHGINRRLIAFPILTPLRFVDLVEQCRPRALVVLAHYFALLSLNKMGWMVGETPKREILGIRSILPDEWQDLMAQPLQTIEAQYSVVQ